MHRNLLRLAPGFFEENRPAEITSRITVDTTIIEQGVGTTVSVALRNLVMGAACIAYGLIGASISTVMVKIARRAPASAMAEGAASVAR